MNRLYQLTPQAREDVLSIWRYIAADNEPAADKLIDRFSETFEQLARQPDMGTRRDQYRAGLRAFLVGRYAIFYERHADGIRIFRVLHGARRFDDLL